MTQEMCDKVVDSSLLALKFVPDWFATGRIIEKLDSAVFPNNYVPFGDLDSDFIAFFSKDADLNSINFDNINLYDDHFDYCDPETINHVRFIVWHIKYTQCKACKNWCVSDDVKKEIGSMFLYFKLGRKIRLLGSMLR